MKNSQLIATNVNKQTKLIQETLDNSFFFIMQNKLNLQINVFRRLSLTRRLLESKNQLYSVIPKIIFENITIIFFSLYLFSYNSSGGSIARILPSLTGFIIIFQRLIPTINQVANSFLKISSRAESINRLIKLGNRNKTPSLDCLEPVVLQPTSICIQNVSFWYQSGFPVLRNINLDISPGDHIGIIGGSGSGKSTLIKCICGLLTPQSGIILLDNQPLHADSDLQLLKNWQKSISYIPQSPFLVDSTVAENIAFMVHLTEINWPQIYKVAKLAQIYDFVSTLPDGFNTRIGQSGNLLSGGQIQRLAIARALYTNPTLVIFDESTSALDENTQSKLIDSLISSPLLDITSISIAHRLTALKNCNKIFKLDSGALVELKF